LQDADLQTRIQLWFTRDGAAPHFRLAVREFLNKVFPEQCTGQGGTTAWPAPSTDLNHLHFYLWGHLKSAVYVTEISDIQDLQQ
jgi:hypothetical protein